MHNFFCSDIPARGECAVLPEAEETHLFRTLRGSCGDHVMLMDGKGRSAEAEILPEKRLKVLRVEQAEAVKPELHLFTAAPRRNKLDSILKQAAELGVRSIHLVKCEYSVAEPENQERMNALLQEACKQSRNPFLPELQLSLSLQEALVLVKKNGWTGFFGDVDNGAPQKEKQAAHAAFFVGPEGGFSETETALLKQELTGLNLGPYILRMETAAVAGIAVLRRICHA